VITPVNEPEDSVPARLTLHHDNQWYQVYCFSDPADAETEGQMVMAGLWVKWKDPKSGGEVLSCTILTCGPNDAMAELHDRMPVILEEADWPKWLGEEPATEEELLTLLKPCPDDVLKIWPVDKAVGNVRNNGAQLVAAI
jgi:putative SOS response-associated peptidase YedK